MELTDINIIKKLAKEHGLQPSRRSGQNFLLSSEVIKEIIKTANLNKNDKVLEIGPGFGTLTTAMLATGASVTAFELDRRLADFNKRYEVLYPNYKIHQADILKSQNIINDEFTDLHYKLVANLPYNITSLILRNFTENKPRPECMVVMLQREVADRITAKPGAMSVLAVAIQFYGQVKKIVDVPASEFWPQPDVDSSVVKIRGIGCDNFGYTNKLKPINVKNFFRLVKIGFSARRKQLHNNLANGLGRDRQEIIEIIRKNGLKSDIRAQSLSVSDWINLCKALQKV